MRYQPVSYKVVIDMFGEKWEAYKLLTSLEKLKAKRLYNKFNNLLTEIEVCLASNHIGTKRFLCVIEVGSNSIIWQGI